MSKISQEKDKASQPDPLKNPAFKPPGILEQIGEAVLGLNRPLDCIQIETTSVCSGKCIYCPHTTQASTWQSRHMQPETFASLWPLLRRAKRAHLQGWGEPLLNPDFFRFQELAAKAGCRTSITTSGFMMNEEIARRIVNSGMDIIAFSLAGTDSSSNAARVGIPFEKVCSAIQTLRKAIREAHKEQGPEIHLAYLMLADRMDAASRLPWLMDELDIDMAVISTLDYLSVPGQRNLALHNTDDYALAEAEALVQDIKSRASSNGRSVHYALPSRTPAPTGCRENISRTVYVSADGLVSPCVYLNSPGRPKERRVFGNVNETDAMSIWNGEDFRQFRRNLLAGQPEDFCLECPKRWEK